VNWGATQGAAAYLIDRTVARGIADYNFPVRRRADHLWEFYKAGAIFSMKALLPSPVRLMPFEPSIGYKASFNMGKFSLEYKARQTLVFARRMRRLLLIRKQERNISLIDASSPIMIGARSHTRPSEE
jgi:hypothetical protein